MTDIHTLFHEITRILNEWDIQQKIVTVVTHNAANVTAAVRQGG